MEKERSSKVIAAVALCVGVVGLSLGFAAFSNTLTISSSASVKPNADTFNVDFSSSETALATDAVVPVKNPTTLNAASASIDNTSSPTITGLSAEFIEPGQSVTYTFYARNEGEYEAFLNSITFANANGETSSKVCTAEGETTQSLVDAACQDITLSVKVGNEAATTGSVADIESHSLAVDGSETIVVTIDYATDGARADGNFSVKFGDITLVYDAVD